ncbi:MAG: NAD(P)/FAD-dependent oxidoreductase [Oscillospiraceae bacterium]|nr:NAD(P)/FAD-dependent oxidoreductase [Oscillospiraceae bacterium]
MASSSINTAVIIGGGAAGMFAGARLSEMGLRATVLEPTGQTLRKLRISGKGRCNLTNNCAVEQVMKNVMRNPKFLYSALDNLSPQDTMAWFESRGVPLKTERGGRVFPISDKASDVAAALEKSDIRIIKDRAVKILTENGAVTGVKGEHGEYKADAVILATGGKSYPKTGSTGDGYKLASDLGHTISEPKASLVPIETKEHFSEELWGFTVKNVTLSLYGNTLPLRGSRKKPIYTELGEMTFQRYGIAGPLSLSASCYIDDKQDYKIVIDLKPGLSMEQLTKRIQRDFDETPNTLFGESLGRLFPRELRADMVRLSEIPQDKPCNQIIREEKERLARLTKNLTLTVTGLRPIEEGIVTRGGVKTGEINPKTMESKIVSGLYFAGEIIDCDAMTGGYNLQIAFATAETAARAILNTTQDGEATWE